jgi:hypothetical protein
LRARPVRLSDRLKCRADGLPPARTAGARGVAPSDRRLARAQRDLDETFRQPGRYGPLPRRLPLGISRLYLAMGDRDKAREHLATAKEMIQRIGYHRRDPELEELEHALP